MLKTVHKSLVGLAALILVVIIAAIVVVPQTTVGVIKVLYNFLTEDLAWLFLLMGVAYSAIAFVCFLRNTATSVSAAETRSPCSKLLRGTR